MLPITHINDLSQEKKSQLFNRFGNDFSDVLIKTVIPIVQDVQKNGNASVISYTEKFDRVTINSVLTSDNEISCQAEKVSSDVTEALQTAYHNIFEFHSRQHRKNIHYTREDGSKMGLIYRPVDKAAVYVPGGKAVYPSSVLMGTIPAKIAGVTQLSLITPPGPDGRIHPVVAAAAQLTGVDTIIKSGGAHGIAAAGYGTETVKKSDLIVGPGNIFVTAAKTYLFSLGLIQIDSMAGPSEVLIIADESADPKWTAWDLLSQAEHEERALAVLVTTSRKFAEEVNSFIKMDIDSKSGRHSIKAAALRNCDTILTSTIEEAIDFSNQYAPEHLQVLVNEPDMYLDLIKNAGSIFLGHYSPVAAGDFISGTNHILPTGGAARFSSGVSVDTFLHRMTYQNLSKDALKSFMPHTDIIAEQEGFGDKHGGSIRIRFNK